MIVGLSILLFACGTASPGTDEDSGTDTSGADTSDTDTGADTSDTDTAVEDDVYPSERGFEFDGAWYTEVTPVQACGNNGNVSTYQVGARTDTSAQALAAWLFVAGGVIPAAGHYTTSAYDGAAGPTEADFVLTDLRDSSQYLSTGESGTITVYNDGTGTMDVVWHDVSLATVFDTAQTSAEGWVSCTY